MDMDRFTTLMTVPAIWFACSLAGYVLGRVWVGLWPPVVRTR